MTQQPPAVNPWSDDDNSAFLRLRMKTFWNGDYFERIILLTISNSLKPLTLSKTTHG